MIRRRLAVVLAIGGYFALNGACLNPRPEEFPSHTPPGSETSGGAGGPTSIDDGQPGFNNEGDGDVPISPDPSDDPPPSSEVPRPADAGVAPPDAGTADAGADAPDGTN